MATVKFRIRRDTAANWTANDPTLALGEPGLETDTRKVKYGDGSTAWTALDYSAAGEVDWADIASKPVSLTAIAALTPAADRYVYYTSGSVAALGTITAFARTILDDANAATVRTTLGLVIGTNVQAYSSKLAAIAAATPIADGAHVAGGITITTVGGIITAIA